MFNNFKIWQQTNLYRKKEPKEGTEQKVGMFYAKCPKVYPANGLNGIFFSLPTPESLFKCFSPWIFSLGHCLCKLIIKVIIYASILLASIDQLKTVDWILKQNDQVHASIWYTRAKEKDKESHISHNPKLQTSKHVNDPLHGYVSHVGKQIECTSTLGGDDCRSSFDGGSVLTPSVLISGIIATSITPLEEHDEREPWEVLLPVVHSSELTSASDLLAGDDSPPILSWEVITFPTFLSKFIDLTLWNRSWTGLVSFIGLLCLSTTDWDLKQFGCLFSVLWLAWNDGDEISGSVPSKLPSLLYGICTRSQISV